MYTDQTPTHIKQRRATVTAYTAMTTQTTSAKMTNRRLHTQNMSYTAHLKNPATAFPSTSGQVTVTCAKTLQYEHHILPQVHFICAYILPTVSTSTSLSLRRTRKYTLLGNKGPDNVTL